MPVLTVNARRIRDKFQDLTSNLNLVRKWFYFIIITESWIIDESKFFLEINGSKSQTLNRVGRTGGGITIPYLEYIRAEVISQFSAVEDSCESILLKAAITG